MKSMRTILTTVGIVIFLPSILSRTISKRAAFYIANETACVVDSIVYYNGDPIPTDDPCEACKCRPPGFACVLRECEVKPGCRAVRKAGHCCPDYICGCEHNGRMFRDGDEIRDSQNPCYTCHCQGSAIACAFVDCFFRVDCAPEYVPGECCPRYDHCPPLGTPQNGSISKDFASTKQPSTTTTIKPTVGIEVFSEDPFFGFADFGADGSVEGLRRKTTSTKVPDIDNDRSKVSSSSSDTSTVSSTTSTTVSTVEASKTPSSSDDSTTPIFYVPEKDSAAEDNGKPTEDSSVVSVDKSAEDSSAVSVDKSAEDSSVVSVDKSAEDFTKESDETTTKQSNTESVNSVTEEVVNRPINSEENIENDVTMNPEEQELPSTEQSSKLLLYSDNDEHNLSNDYKPVVPEKENEEKIILSEIHDAQDHGKENLENVEDKNPVTTIITTEKSMTTKIVFGDRIKSTSTIAPLPVLLSNSKVLDKHDKDGNNLLNEVNKEVTDTTERNLLNTEVDTKSTESENNKQIDDVKSIEQNDNQVGNLTESTATTFEFTPSKNKREGKKKNVNVNDQKLPTELPSTIPDETKKDNTEIDLTSPSTQITFKVTTEKSSEVEYKLNSETQSEIKSTFFTDNFETSTKTNPTQITEQKKLLNQQTSTKDFSNSETPSTTETSVSESETKSTSSLHTSLSDKDVHIGHEITH